MLGTARIAVTGKSLHGQKDYFDCRLKDPLFYFADHERPAYCFLLLDTNESKVRVIFRHEVERYHQILLGSHCSQDWRSTSVRHDEL